MTDEERLGKAHKEKKALEEELRTLCPEKVAAT